VEVGVRIIRTDDHDRTAERHFHGELNDGPDATAVDLLTDKDQVKDAIGHVGFCLSGRPYNPGLVAVPIEREAGEGLQGAIAGEIDEQCLFQLSSVRLRLVRESAYWRAG